MELPGAVQVTVGAITVTAQATSFSDRHDKQGSGNFYLATNGDSHMAISGDLQLGNLVGGSPSGVQTSPQSAGHERSHEVAKDTLFARRAVSAALICPFVFAGPVKGGQ
jgi:hypothetical protein